MLTVLCVIIAAAAAYIFLPGVLRGKDTFHLSNYEFTKESAAELERFLREKFPEGSDVDELDAFLVKGGAKRYHEVFSLKEEQYKDKGVYVWLYSFNLTGKNIEITSKYNKDNSIKSIKSNLRFK